MFYLLNIVTLFLYFAKYFRPKVFVKFLSTNWCLSWRCAEEENEKVDEVHHWTNERYVAIALLPIIPAALAYPHPVLDTALVSAMCLHTHWSECPFGFPLHSFIMSLDLCVFNQVPTEPMSSVIPSQKFRTEMFTSADCC